MIEISLAIALFVIACFVLHALAKTEPAMRVVLPGDPMHTPDHSQPIPWHDARVPDDATHIGWIMHGEGELGRVHTLYLQDIESLRREVLEAQSTWGPIIATSIELECDIRSRGCVPITEILYVIARVDRDGNEQWLSRSRNWVNRWDESAQIYEVFPAKTR